MHATLDSHIESTPGTCGGRPRIAGTRIRVQDIYVWHDLHGRSADDIVASFPQLTLGDVHAALAYAFDHRSEITAGLVEDEQFVDELRRVSGPGPLEELQQSGRPA
jgi:uncharacterized protein (DUF433 family)